jgi:hypothetical protein
LELSVLEQLIPLALELLWLEQCFPLLLGLSELEQVVPSELSLLEKQVAQSTLERGTLCDVVLVFGSIGL